MTITWPFALTWLLIGLMWTGVIDWSWWLIVSPAIIVCALAIVSECIKEWRRLQ